MFPCTVCCPDRPRWTPRSLARAVCVLLSLSCIQSTSAKKIDGAANLPFYSQKQDYSNLVKDLSTDMQIPAGTALKYSQLPTAAAGGKRVLFDPAPKEPWFVGNAPPAAPVRLFSNNDLSDIFNGTFHCAPATGAMVMQYYSTRQGFAALGIKNASEAAYINEIGHFMDVNDQNPDLNKNVRGHMGVYESQIPTGLMAFAQSRDNKIQLNITIGAFDAAKYKMEIDANRPVIILGKTNTIGHAVVGVGYHPKANGEVDSLILRDPASFNQEEDGVDPPVATSNLADSLNSLVGFRTNLEGDLAITTFVPPGSPVLDGVMITLDPFLIPEPASALLLALGALVVRTRRSRATHS